jgi:CBS domain-containing protein
MSKPVITVEMNAPIMEAVKTMVAHAIGCVVVTDAGKPVGVFTRRDLMNRVLMKKLDLNQIKVKDVMSSPLISIDSNEDFISASELMKEHNVNRLIVFEEGELAGIVTMTDIELKIFKGYFPGFYKIAYFSLGALMTTILVLILLYLKD